MMVGGAITDPAATTEPDMKLPLHPAPQITGSLLAGESPVYQGDQPMFRYIKVPPTHYGVHHVR